jgi:hypothetical protein
MNEQDERTECIRAFEVDFDNDIDSFGESCIVLALDITQAQVIAHDCCNQLRELTKQDLRVKGIHEQCFVVAPELGLKVELWMERIKKVLEEDDD